MEVKSCLWCKLLSKCLTIANRVDWRNELELVAEGALEGKEASFEERGGLRELSLQSEIISNENQGLMMVEVAMTELNQSLNVHSLLYLCKFDL